MYTHPFIFRAAIIALALAISTCASLPTTAEQTKSSPEPSEITTEP